MEYVSDMISKKFHIWKFLNLIVATQFYYCGYYMHQKILFRTHVAIVNENILRQVYVSMLPLFTMQVVHSSSYAPDVVPFNV